MAAASSDPENVLLQSDEGSPSPPRPAGRLPFKAPLAVGLCVFAAGLAAAVMMGRPAVRAPTKIWHPWSATGLQDSATTPCNAADETCFEGAICRRGAKEDSQGLACDWSKRVAECNGGCAEGLACDWSTGSGGVCRKVPDWLLHLQFATCHAADELCYEEDICRDAYLEIGQLAATAGCRDQDCNGGCAEGLACDWSTSWGGVCKKKAAPCKAADETCFEGAICRDGAMEDFEDHNCRGQDCNGGCAEGLACDWSSGSGGVCKKKWKAAPCKAADEICYEGEICRDGAKEDFEDLNCYEGGICRDGAHEDFEGPYFSCQYCNGGCAEGLACDWSTGSGGVCKKKWNAVGQPARAVRRAAPCKAADTQSMEWTPAAHVLALVAGMLALSGLMLIFPCRTNCFYKVEPHTQKVCKNRLFELRYGSHILYWSCAIVGGFVAGGAQITCILLLPSMLAWTCYHYSASSKPHAVMSFVLAVALAYFGFVPFPTKQALIWTMRRLWPMRRLAHCAQFISIWTPAAIFLTMQTAQVLLAALPFLVGGKIMDAQYDQKPWVKELFCDKPEGILSDVDTSDKTNSYCRAREISLGAQLMGIGCCQLGAIISGGAQDMCLLAALPLIISGYCHWLQREFKGEKATAIFSWVIVAAMVGFGMAR